MNKATVTDSIPTKSKSTGVPSPAAPATTNTAAPANAAPSGDTATHSSKSSTTTGPAASDDSTDALSTATNGSSTIDATSGNMTDAVNGTDSMGNSTTPGGTNGASQLTGYYLGAKGLWVQIGIASMTVFAGAVLLTWA